MSDDRVRLDSQIESIEAGIDELDDEMIDLACNLNEKSIEHNAIMINEKLGLKRALIDLKESLEYTSTHKENNNV